MAVGAYTNNMNDDDDEVVTRFLEGLLRVGGRPRKIQNAAEDQLFLNSSTLDCNSRRLACSVPSKQY